MLWTNFCFDNKRSFSNKDEPEGTSRHILEMNGDKCRKFIENYQPNLQADHNDLKEEFSNYKFKLCKDLTSLVPHHRVFNIPINDNNVKPENMNVIENIIDMERQPMKKGRLKNSEPLHPGNLLSSGLCQTVSKYIELANITEDVEVKKKTHQNDIFGFRKKKTVGIKCGRNPKGNKANLEPKWEDSNYDSSVISLDIQSIDYNSKQLILKNPIKNSDRNLDNMTLKSSVKPKYGNLEIIQDQESNDEDSIDSSHAMKKSDISNNSRTKKSKIKNNRISNLANFVGYSSKENDIKKHKPDEYQRSDTTDNITNMLEVPSFMKKNLKVPEDIDQTALVIPNNKRRSLVDKITGKNNTENFSYDKDDIKITRVNDSLKVFDISLINYNAMYYSAILTLPFTQTRYMSLDLWKYGSSTTEEIFDLHVLHQYFYNKPGKNSIRNINNNLRKDSNDNMPQFMHKEISELMILDSSNIMVKQLATMVHSINDKHHTSKPEEKYLEKLLDANQNSTEVKNITLDIEMNRYVNLEDANESFTEEFILVDLGNNDLDDIISDVAKMTYYKKVDHNCDSPDLFISNENKDFEGFEMNRIMSFEKIWTFIDDEDECLDLEDANQIGIDGGSVKKNLERQTIEDTMEFYTLQQTLLTSDFLSELQCDKSNSGVAGFNPFVAIHKINGQNKKSNHVINNSDYKNNMAKLDHGMLDPSSSNYQRGKSRNNADSSNKSMNKLIEPTFNNNINDVIRLSSRRNGHLDSITHINFPRNANDISYQLEKSANEEILQLSKRECGPFDYDKMDQQLEASKEKNRVWVQDKVFEKNQTIIYDNFNCTVPLEDNDLKIHSRISNTFRGLRDKKKSNRTHFSVFTKDNDNRKYSTRLSKYDNANLFNYNNGVFDKFNKEDQPQSIRQTSPLDNWSNISEIDMDHKKNALFKQIRYKPKFGKTMLYPTATKDTKYNKDLASIKYHKAQKSLDFDRSDVMNNEEEFQTINPRKNDPGCVINMLTPSGTKHDALKIKNQNNFFSDKYLKNVNNKMVSQEFSDEGKDNCPKIMKRLDSGLTEVTINFSHGYSGNITTDGQVTGSKVVQNLLEFNRSNMFHKSSLNTNETNELNTKSTQELIEGLSPTKKKTNMLFPSRTQIKRKSQVTTQTNTQLNAIRDFDAVQQSGQGQKKKANYKQGSIIQKTDRIMGCESNLQFQKKGSIEINFPQNWDETKKKVGNNEDGHSLFSQYAANAKANPKTPSKKNFMDGQRSPAGSRLSIIDDKSLDDQHSQKAGFGNELKTYTKKLTRIKTPTMIAIKTDNQGKSKDKEEVTKKKTDAKRNFFHKGSSMDKSKIVMKHYLYTLAKKKNMNNQEKLFFSVYQNQISEFEDLANIYPDIVQNGKDKNGLSQLHVSVISGHGEICKNILNRKINPNMQDKKGNTPLHYAFISDNDQITDILISCGANQQLTNELGKTPWNYQHNN